MLVFIPMPSISIWSRTSLAWTVSNPLEKTTLGFSTGLIFDADEAAWAG
ncbi:hypothetical protein [Candidatus Manganitrophus noduliformans]|nr:hypothetical protein [Candidatus Manganitrophus noduliformans]